MLVTFDCRRGSARSLDSARDDSYLVDDDDSSLGTTVISGDGGCSGIVRNGSGRGRPLHSCTALLAEELVPGFSVFVVFGVFQVGGEGYVDLVVEGGRWDYVPGVGFDYVGGDEVYLILGVGLFVVGDVALVGASAFVFGAFDLDAEEASVVLDGEVVAGHVSPGLGDAESVLGGAGHETEFGPFAPELGVLDIDTLVCHFCLSDS
jgi:hypothetical protein